LAEKSEAIDWADLLLPSMIHGVCILIALLVFMVQTGRALCKYGYHTVLSSYFYCAGIRRQAARRTGQGVGIEDREDNIAPGEEGDMSEEEAAAGNTNDYDEIEEIM
jgi:hypothetical protein